MVGWLALVGGTGILASGAGPAINGAGGSAGVGRGDAVTILRKSQTERGIVLGGAA